MLDGEHGNNRVNARNGKILLSLFRSDFVRTGKITIAKNECIAVLRACSFLRIELRNTALSSLSNEDLEVVFDPNLYSSDEHHPMKCYLFLATLQDVVLKDLLVTNYIDDVFRDFVRRLFSRTLTPSRKRQDLSGPSCSLGARPGHDIEDYWQVVVINDPVNLMAYVVAVLRDEFAFSEQIAEQRMREVHERKSSIVWEGLRAEAEAHVCALHAWHLQAEARPKVLVGAQDGAKL